jgi:4-phosphopantoate--beta-alanine ligase
VNGNVAALCSEDLVLLSNMVKAPLEINIFYYKKGRVDAIKKILEEAGAQNILGTDESTLVKIEELSSNRRNVDPNGIKISDVVFVLLEDGDRTEALKKLGKIVIAVDLNPLSRTAIWADITIVDNIIRTIPRMTEIALKYKHYSKEQLQNIVDEFNNKKNIQNTLEFIIEYINLQKDKAFDILYK